MTYLTLKRLALVTALTVGTLSQGITVAEAMPITQGQFNLSDIVPAQYVPRSNKPGAMNWQMQRDGNRCRTRTGNCQHYHQGFYYQNLWWTLPLIIGSTAANGNNGGSHIQWCRAHYRSYNSQTNMWLGNSGKHYQCKSPY